MDEALRNHLSNQSRTKIAVENLDDGKKFASGTDASKYYNIKKAAILMCAKGQRKTAGGYHWRVIPTETKPDVYTIMRVEDEKKYYTIAEASRDNNISRAAIYKCLKGTMHTANGYHWQQL